ncbi:hypothetical protein ACFV1C_00345 [Streptomyces sp. NPDC059605]|uniref:hypothetical protein n=1 Tax=Streptomyces sp. NPDC059605 TaxID=3346882 RepID=UPI00367D9005
MSDPARLYELTIVCPRPQRTAPDDWHIQPERIASTVASFFVDAELTLTPRTARLHIRWTGHLGDLTEKQRRMATVLSCLRFDIARDHTGNLLPLPVRTEIREVITAPATEEPGR